MAEQTTVKIPIEIQPPQQRRSLHSVRMGQSIVNSVAAQAEAAQAEQPTYSQPAQGDYQPQETTYVENQFGNGNQQAHAPQRPDSSQFDMWDEQQAAEYHRQNDAYMEAMIDRRVQAALQPSRQALNEAEAVEQYNRAFAKYGDDPNFKSTLEEALQVCARDIQTGKPLDIEKRYSEVSESVSRRPDQRLSHLPNRAKTVGGLGALIDHNHKTGRARPFNNRNWRG